MVSFQALDLPELAALYQSFDDATGIRPTIDVIAKKNQNRLFRRLPDVIMLDTSQQVIEQIEATMYVAYGINPHAFGHMRAGSNRTRAAQYVQQEKLNPMFTMDKRIPSLMDITFDEIKLVISPIRCRNRLAGFRRIVEARA